MTGMGNELSTALLNIVLERIIKASAIERTLRERAVYHKPHMLTSETTYH